MKENLDENIVVNEAFEDLLLYCKRSKSKDNKVLLRKAFLFADNAHKGVKRKSGEPYILHPIAVAKIVAQEIGLGTKATCAALLHDVVEDTHFTLEDIENAFGAKIAYIVDGLTKIEGIFSTDISKQAENLRKILLTLSDDMRVILVKLADRLHNMRTLEHMPAHKQMRISSETLSIFAPMAYRLGLRKICEELESLSFKYMYPNDYQEIENKLLGTKEKNEVVLEEFIRPIRAELEEAGYKFTIEGRQKSVFSTWRKMQRKHISFEEVYDRLAVRIIFEPQEGSSEADENLQCFFIYNIVAQHYRQKSERMRDWINEPRSTGYRALHLTAMADSGDWVEVQIRSKKMNEIAEHGVAAHWNYKEERKKMEFDDLLTDIQLLFEDKEADPVSFLEDFKLVLYYDEMDVYTPKGDVHSLPKNATVLDFAYKIHSDLGNKCIGAKVNRKIRPLQHKLHAGDQVEILTSEKQVPKEEWLDIVITGRAKSRLKSIFRAERKGKIEKGQGLLDAIFEKSKFSPLQPEGLQKLLQYLKIDTKEQLFMELATGELTENEVKKAYSKADNVSFIPYTTLKFSNPFSKKKVTDNNSEDTPKYGGLKSKVINLIDDKIDKEYAIAKCCKPIPGDDVVGFVGFNGNIEVHKRKCPRILKVAERQGERLVTAHWKTKKLKSFLAVIGIEGVDRHGLLNEITNLISNDYGVNMHALSIKVLDGVLIGKIELYVPHTKELNDLIYKISKVKGITSINRKEK